ncbi:MAG: hypothetical protein ACREA9_02550 [Pyrinomonadaceae bacterium]
MSKVFIGYWLDADGNIIDETEESILKETKELALASLGARCRQSPHLLHPNAYGFYIVPQENVTEGEKASSIKKRYEKFTEKYGN